MRIKSLILIRLITIASTSFFKKITRFDVSQLNPSLVLLKSNTPIGCLAECSNRMSCNLVTHTFPNICKLYNILDENYCITNYTSIASTASNLYIKTKKTFGAACQRSNQCTEEFGLTCNKKICVCQVNK